MVRDIAVLAALALFSELCLRWFAPEYGHKLFDNEYTGSYPLAYNADGYRGARIALDKNYGEYRILALGDSETMGTGLPVEGSWPAQLGKLLGRPGHKVSVINAGLEGNSLADIHLAWQSKWRAYHPDCVVLGLTANMVSLSIIRRKVVGPDEKFRNITRIPSRLAQLKIEANRALHRAYLSSFLSLQSQKILYRWGLIDHRLDPRFPAGPMLAYGWRQGDIPKSLPEDAWAQFEQELTRSKRDVEEGGAQFVGIWLTPRFELSDSYADNEKNVPKERFTIDPHERIRAIAARSLMTVVDTLPALRKERAGAPPATRRAPLYIHFDYNHLDDVGSGIVARVAAEALANDVRAERDTQRRCVGGNCE